MELNEKEAHCIARLLQGAFYSDNILSGCTFCKFRCDNDEQPLINSIRKRLYDETYVDVRLGSDRRDELPFSDFPYKRFLKTSNEPIKEYFGKIFADI